MLFGFHRTVSRNFSRTPSSPKTDVVCQRTFKVSWNTSQILFLSLPYVQSGSKMEFSVTYCICSSEYKSNNCILEYFCFQQKKSRLKRKFTQEILRTSSPSIIFVIFVWGVRYPWRFWMIPLWLLYERHYNPRFVYFLPTFWNSFMYCYLWPYVWLEFNSGL